MVVVVTSSGELLLGEWGYPYLLGPSGKRARALLMFSGERSLSFNTILSGGDVG